jgi:hypothetical protein
MRKVEKIIFELLIIIDDIDTLSDVCKNDLESFQKLTLQQVAKANNIVSKDLKDYLFDTYYKRKDDILFPMVSGDDDMLNKKS